jgi:hypothetical protein
MISLSAETKYWKARQAGSSFLVELDAPTLEGMRQVSCVAKTCEAQGSDPSEAVWVTQLVDGVSLSSLERCVLIRRSGEATTSSLLIVG